MHMAEYRHRSAGQPYPPYAVIPEFRKMMTARAACISTTLDFSRKYLDIVNSRGSYVMENWLHFAETYSVCILAPDQSGRQILPPASVEMWRCLRLAIVHYFRASRAEATASIVCSREARANIKRYAKLAEKHLGPAYLTYNLHLLVERYVSISLNWPLQFVIQGAPGGVGWG
jgi:hypothetical protein